MTTPKGLYAFVPAGYYVTTDDYAREYGLSPATVRRHCVSGRLNAVKVGKAWLVNYDHQALPCGHKRWKGNRCAEMTCLNYTGKGN